MAAVTATAQAPQSPVALGSAARFALLAGTTITNTGGGVINGDVGVSPGTTFVQGAATVNGAIHLGNPTAAQAQADLTTAFNDAAGRAVPTLVAGNIGGQTLAPGLYKSTSSLAISSGDLTLDARGNPNAVFIFQIASTLTTTSGRQVILAGGANAANIFWQVGSSATLGTTSLFQGNILAAISITVNTGATLVGRALAQSGAVTLDTNGGGSTTVPVAPTAPTVTSTVPANGATAVPIGNRVTATFSEAMDPSTITTGTFTLQQGTTPVSGTVSYAGLTATFTPASNLAASATFTARITTGARNPAGNALASNYVWSFATGATADTTPPTVSSTVPANGASGVPIGNRVSATFSEAMDPSTITTGTFTLQQGATPVSGAVTYVGAIATFAPATTLAPNTAYTATITTGARDLAGNALVGNFVWSFTTGATPDTTPPTVSSTAPANSAAGVALGSNITATFSKAMDPATITTATVTLQQGATPVSGTVTYSGTTATFTPATTLAPNTAYAATITTGAKDLAGNALASPFLWSFTTGAATGTTPPPVISQAGTVNAGSFVAPVAAGSIASVFGSNLALGGATAASITPLPTALGGTSFRIGAGGAPLFFVSPSQVNLQIPWELAGQAQASVIATVAGVASSQQTVSLAPFAPGIFAMNMAGSGQGAILIGGTAQLAAPGTPAVRGGFISIFCTGLGAVTNQPATGAAAQASPLSITLTVPTVSIGGLVAGLNYSGLAPGFVGLYQVNAQVPAGTSPGNAVPVVISVGNATSNTVTIAVQ